MCTGQSFVMKLLLLLEIFSSDNIDIKLHYSAFSDN